MAMARADTKPFRFRRCFFTRTTFLARRLTGSKRVDRAAPTLCGGSGMIEAALFDIDGTLIDSVEAHAKAWTIAFAEHGVEAAFDEVRRQIGKGADKLLPEFLDKAALDALGKRIDARQAEIFKDDYLRQIRPFPGVRPLFERLKSDGVKRVLATSGKPEDVSAYKEIANIADLVDTGATSE